MLFNAARARDSFSFFSGKAVSFFMRRVSESTNIRERKRKKKGEKAERNFFGRDINDVTAFLSLSLSLSLVRARFRKN